jgi:pimeloyl-ACP methyl ester carboxylesterase
VASDGARTTPGGLYVHEAGEGPLVVLVHGVMDRSSGMLRSRRLLQEEHRIVRYDRRGYGRSKAAAPSDDFDWQVTDLLEVLDGRPAVIVGHSFGGVLALALADRYRDLARSVVAYEAPMTWEPWWPGGTTPVAAATGEADGGSAAAGDVDGDGAVDGGSAAGGRPPPADGEAPAEVAEWFMRRMIGDDLWERLPPAMRADRRAEGPALLADMASVQPPAPMPYVAERIGVPVLAAHGGATRSRHRRTAEELARRVPGAELAVVPGADHGVHLSDPAGFAALVRRGVERAAGR